MGNDAHLLRGIELIIRPECNQKCEYCYVARYGDKLFPHKDRLTNEQILHRVDMFLDYVFNQKQMFINHWELFAGDLFYDDLAFDIFDVFYKYVSDIYDKYRRIASISDNRGLISMPCNFSFIDDDEKVARLEEYIKKFEEKNWDLGLSISTDGLSAVDTREQRELNEDHFDRLFKWTVKHPAMGFHPIISASNVDNAIEGYEWWKENYQKYYNEETRKQNPDYDFDLLPYWLEARNDEWTQDKIQSYINLLDYMYEDRLKMCDNDIDKLAYHLFCSDTKDGVLPQVKTNDLINLRIEHHFFERSITQCSLSHCMCVNLSNFSVVPCHRLTYPQFNGFKFVLNEENTQIVDVEPQNMSGFLTTVLHGEESRPRCASCIYKWICHKGCLGAQFESSGELFQPAISVCQLFFNSFDFLINKYHTTGLLKSARKQGLLSPTQEIVFGEILMQKLGYSYEEVYCD
jgi:radical SAM protein with 4Fe4S-binding SPASM domain